MDMMFFAKLINGEKLSDILDIDIVTGEGFIIAKLMYNDNILSTTSICKFITEIQQFTKNIVDTYKVYGLTASIMNKIGLELYAKSKNIDKLISFSGNSYVYSFGFFYVTDYKDPDTVVKEVKQYLDIINEIIEDELMELKSIIMNKDENDFKQKLVKDLNENKEVEFSLTTVDNNTKYMIRVTKYPDPDDINNYIYHVEIKESETEEITESKTCKTIDEITEVIIDTIRS